MLTGKLTLVEILTRNIQMSRRHYGLVVKIFTFGYKGRGFESPHVHFHTGDPATCNTQSTPTHLNQQRLSLSISLTHEPHAQQPDAWGELCGNPDPKYPNVKTPLWSSG